MARPRHHSPGDRRRDGSGAARSGHPRSPLIVDRRRPAITRAAPRPFELRPTAGDLRAGTRLDCRLPAPPRRTSNPPVELVRASARTRRVRRSTRQPPRACRRRREPSACCRCQLGAVDARREVERQRALRLPPLGRAPRSAASSATICARLEQREPAQVGRDVAVVRVQPVLVEGVRRRAVGWSQTESPVSDLPNFAPDGLSSSG